MTDRSEWEGRVGRKWAEEWRRTDRSFAGLTERLLARVSELGPRQVLDVGCGAGELSLAVARAHSGAEVIGVDVSEELVSAARDRAAHLANASFEVADAASWTRAGFAPDLVMSRHGVMFFADPVAAFAQLAVVAAPGAHLVFSCFRDRSENGWATDLAALLPGAPAPEPASHAPSPFAFADPDHVADILDAAGWSEIGFEPVDFAYVAGVGKGGVDDAHSYFLSIGPAARAAAELDPEARAEFSARLRAHLESIADGGLVAMKAAAWIVSARRDRAAAKDI